MAEEEKLFMQRQWIILNELNRPLFAFGNLQSRDVVINTESETSKVPQYLAVPGGEKCSTVDSKLVKFLRGGYKYFLYDFH